MKISREAIRQFVADNEGRVDMRRQMLWGFFFKHDDSGKLEALRGALERDGYRYVELSPREDLKWWLEVSVAEPLTADALFERCAALHELGRDHAVEFDGFDVGNVDGLRASSWSSESASGGGKDRP